MPLWISIICIVAAVVIGASAGIFLGIAIRKNTAEKEIGSAAVSYTHLLERFMSVNQGRNLLNENDVRKVE